MLIDKRKTAQWATLVVLLISLSFQVQAQDTLKVLFVGNSYTYFWNMAQHVEAMASSQGELVVARKSTAGGASLKQHWDGEKGLKSRELITEGDWDIVVLQNHSLSAINDYDEFMEYGAKFIRLVRESGAKPILFTTWARLHNPLMQKNITMAYQDLATAHQIGAVPVGPIWERVRELRPDLQLYAEDGSHPSPIGTYLTACVFYSILTGKKATGMPERLKTIDRNNEELYLSIMSKENASFLQQVIDEYLRATDEDKR